MTTEVADISSYQEDSLEFMQTLGQYAKSVIVKLTQGSASGDAYVNPKAASQISNGFKVFKSVGVYHYFKGNSQQNGNSDPINEAKWFDQHIQAQGLNKSTVCAIDVEDSSLMQDATHDVNLFLQYMSEQGYSHLVVYASASWFNYGRIQRDLLYNHAPIWVASYDVSEPGVNNANAWQYTDDGHGLGVDFSYDFDGTLLGTQENTQTTPAAQTGSSAYIPTDALHQHADEVYQYFHQKGLSDAAICGILGNFQHESNINPTQWQIGMPETWSMYSETGYGIAQFTPAGKIKEYADTVGKSVSDITVQLDYIWGQVTTNGFFGGGQTFQEFAVETDPAQAAIDFLRGYEMHSMTTDALQEREQYADQWWSIYNRGNAGTYGVNTRKMDISAVQNTPDMFTLSISGSFTFSVNCAVRNTPEMSATGIATYTDGSTVYYDQKLKNDGHLWLSYLSASGIRHYVPYANTSTGDYFGFDSNSVDPISTKNTGSVSPTTTPITPVKPATPPTTTETANTTPEMYTIRVSGSFTFDTNCRVRNTPEMDDNGIATYTSGMTVYYDQKVKNDGHFWLSYLSTDGTRHYVPYANIATQTYFGTDSNPVNPVTSGPQTTATAPKAPGTVATTPEMYTIQVSGTFTFNTNCRVRNTPEMSDNGVATYTSGMTVNYDQKIKNDGHFWLSYLSESGVRRYIPYANFEDNVYFGTDTNSQNPIDLNS